jgi:hypothetical protein
LILSSFLHQVINNYLAARVTTGTIFVKGVVPSKQGEGLCTKDVFIPSVRCTSRHVSPCSAYTRNIYMSWKFTFFLCFYLGSLPVLACGTVQTDAEQEKQGQQGSVPPVNCVAAPEVKSLSYSPPIASGAAPVDAAIEKKSSELKSVSEQKPAWFSTLRFAPANIHLCPTWGDSYASMPHTSIELADSIAFTIHSDSDDFKNKLSSLGVTIHQAYYLKVEAKDAKLFFQAVRDIQESRGLTVSMGEYNGLVKELMNRSYLSSPPDIAVTKTIEDYKEEALEKKEPELAIAMAKLDIRNPFSWIVNAYAWAEDHELKSVTNRVKKEFGEKFLVVHDASMFGERETVIAEIRNANLIRELSLSNFPSGYMPGLVTFLSGNTSVSGFRLGILPWGRQDLEARHFSMLANVLRVNTTLKSLTFHAQNISDAVLTELLEALRENEYSQVCELRLVENGLTSAALGVLGAHLEATRHRPARLNAIYLDERRINREEETAFVRRYFPDRAP